MPGSEFSLRAVPRGALWQGSWFAWARPYLWPLLLAASLPLLFWADALVENRDQQHLLGLAMFGLLFVATRSAPAHERRLVWLAVGVWSVVEVLASVVWGLYHYRLGGVPLFVPPGHGVVYLFGLRASQTPLFRRYGQEAGWLALGCAGLWAIGGLVVMPHWTGRVDLAGALLWPVLALSIRRSKLGAFYTGIFLVTSMLEIVGTAFGTWAWAAAQPLTTLPSGNPPSVIAGAYCLVDLFLLRLALHLGLTSATSQPAGELGTAGDGGNVRFTRRSHPQSAK